MYAYCVCKQIDNVLQNDFPDSILKVQIELLRVFVYSVYFEMEKGK